MPDEPIHTSPTPAITIEERLLPTTCSLSDLYLTHRSSLVRLVRPLVDTVDAAEEVVHDVFARMLRTGRFPDHNPGGYLRTAALNAARSELRRREAARRHQRRVASERLADADDVEAPLVQRLDRERLTNVLEELAPRQRAVIELRFLHGLAEREVAERLGISPGSVKTHTSRGLQALRARIAEESAA